MAKDFTATISGKSERAESWRQVYGSETINIKSPIPTFANLPGIGDTQIYELDLDLLTTEQRAKLVNYIATKFDIPVAEVDRDLNILGCPILAEDITVTIHNPLKWI